MRKLPAALAVSAVPLVLSVPTAHAADAEVSVLHGVPGLTVDVYANGDKLIPDFTPGTLTDPMPIPEGEYDLAVYPAGADPNATQPAISADGVAVPGGGNVTLVAHLGADGAPTLTPFVNDTSAVPAGQGRLTVRHTAAAPAVDARAGGSPVVTNLTNPNEKSLEVPAGTVSADVVLAGTSTVAIGPADVNVAEGANTIVYAWGSAADSNLQLAVQNVTAKHSAPNGVPSGEAIDSSAGVPLAGVFGIAAIVLAAAGGRRLAAARSRR